MRVLVTGGAGYIGSHAVMALVRAGHDLVGDTVTRLVGTPVAQDAAPRRAAALSSVLVPAEPGWRAASRDLETIVAHAAVRRGADAGGYRTAVTR